MRRIPAVTPDAQVTLTAATARSDDVMLLLLRGHRVRFHDNGDGTCTGVFRMPAIAGPLHVGVNALANGTLFDDQAPCDSQGWLSPCVVGPMPVADELP